MPQTSFTQDPQAVLDYTIDWLAWLGTDTIAASAWTAEDGLTIVTDTHTATAATVWLSGGEVGSDYNVTNHITTAGGRQDDQTIRVKIKNK